MSKSDEKTSGSGLTHNPFGELAKRRAELEAASPNRHGKVAASASRAPAAPPQHRMQNVHVHLEPEGRSGKVVTRISGLPSHNLLAIAARLERALGCHASIRVRDVLLGGSLKDRVVAWLESAGDLAAIRDEPRPVPAKSVAPPQLELTQREPEPPAMQRSSVRRGLRVAIVLKADQGSGRLTEGVVRDILTGSPHHPRGIKVRLDSGEVGRVQRILG